MNIQENEVKNLNKYIFNDVFDYFNVQNCEGERLRYISKFNIFLKYIILNKVSSFFINIYNFNSLKKVKKKSENSFTILFLADPILYNDLLSEIDNNYQIIITNPFKNINSKKNLFSLIFRNISINLIYGFEKNLMKYTIKAISRLEFYLIKSNTKQVIINDSIHPINRAIIYVSKKLNIKTIEIQHAIYPSEMILMKGSGPDFVFVWGNYFKEMYIKQKIRCQDSIKILGYPFKIMKYEKRNQKKPVLYYLAQGFHLQDINNLDILISNAINLKGICEKYEIEFRCRLHPNSPQILLDKILPIIKCTPKNETIEDSISYGDIFVSFNSTALIQANINNKICIQLINIPVETDNFEEIGTSIKSFNNIPDLESYVIEIVNDFNSFKFHQNKKSNYVEILSESPSKTFLELLTEIDKRKSKKNI